MVVTPLMIADRVGFRVEIGVGFRVEIRVEIGVGFRTGIRVSVTVVVSVKVMG